MDDYTYEIRNVKSLCRICLTQSKNMIPLDVNLESNKKGALIIEVLEDVVGTMITNSSEYPKVICAMCLRLLKLSHNLKIQFFNSEKVLLQHFKKTMNTVLLDSNNKNCDIQSKDFTEEQSPVEIIVGSNKYKLNDILIVEEDEQENVDFEGFLHNLGKTVSAKFINKSSQFTKNLCEEEPVVLIEKLESKENVMEFSSDIEHLDQYVITKGDNDILFKKYDRNVSKDHSSNNVYLENLPSADQELFRSALKKQFKCNSCKKLYSSRGRLRRHLEFCGTLKCQEKNRISFKKNVVKCDLCARIFMQKKFLNYHIKTAHNTDPLMYKCEICSEVLRNKNVFMSHKLTKHGERKFVCEICNQKFFTSSCLKNHKLRHAQKKVAQCVCPVCGKTFHYKGGLFYHMKLHNNDRKYCCEFCDKKFYTLNAKKRHTLTHTGVRPYACKYCEKHFFSKGEVRKHECLHTGIRPYHCQYCPKGFSSTYNMKVHLVSHPGPYACTICDRTFVNMNVLQFHLKSKHSIKEENSSFS